jgi:hypothetical protein
LHNLRDAGVIDKETHDKILKENPSRIPSYRIREQGKTGGPSGGNVRSPIKERTEAGAKLDIKDITKSLMQDAFTRAQITRKSIADRAFIDMAEKIGAAEKVASTRPAKFDLSDAETRKLGIDDEASYGVRWRRT